LTQGEGCDKVSLFENSNLNNKAEYPLSPCGNWADRRSMFFINSLFVQN
jgi:hypothetical protein